MVSFVEEIGFGIILLNLECEDSVKTAFIGANISTMIIVRSSGHFNFECALFAFGSCLIWLGGHSVYELTRK